MKLNLSTCSEHVNDEDGKVDKSENFLNENFLDLVFGDLGNNFNF